MANIAGMMVEYTKATGSKIKWTEKESLHGKMEGYMLGNIWKIKKTVKANLFGRMEVDM